MSKTEKEHENSENFSTKKSIAKMSDDELKEVAPSGRNFMQIYDKKLPQLLSVNLELQERALEVVRDKIDQANAVQAATIYGILHDKASAMTGNAGIGNQNINMYIGDNKMSSSDMVELIGRVADRMKNQKTAIDVDVGVVK